MDRMDGWIDSQRQMRDDFIDGWMMDGWMKT